MSTEDVSHYLYSWNAPATVQMKRVRVEDDIREALQSAYINQRPSVDQRKELLEIAVKIGVQYTFLGFPAASPREQAECNELVQYISSRKLAITPILMSRAVPDDLRPIIDVQQSGQSAVLADLYISTSPLRMKVEGWDLDDMLRRLRNVAKLASDDNLRFRVAFEDSSRTPPDALAQAVHAVVDMGPECIVLNDTVGDCDPEGASQITAFVNNLLEETNLRIELAWHGHNDRGLSLANALAAAKSGASIISGTFMGVGERTGNTPLEQLIYILANAGNAMYDVRQLMPMCKLFSEIIGAEIPVNLPLVGKQAFATSTGTHAAAILKARKLAVEFEDHVFSSVSAHQLGREQSIFIGPNSGRSSIRSILEGLRIPYNDDLISGLLSYCKERGRYLRDDDEISALVKSMQR